MMGFALSAIKRCNLLLVVIQNQNLNLHLCKVKVDNYFLLKLVVLMTISTRLSIYVTQGFSLNPQLL